MSRRRNRSWFLASIAVVATLAVAATAATAQTPFPDTPEEAPAPPPEPPAAKDPEADAGADVIQMLEDHWDWAREYIEDETTLPDDAEDAYDRTVPEDLFAEGPETSRAPAMRLALAEDLSQGETRRIDAGPARSVGTSVRGPDANPLAMTSGGGYSMVAYAVSLAAGVGFLLGPLSLYRRVKKSKALDNDVRRSIFKFVENNPGATITEVAEGVGVSHSTATYHVKILTEFDLITKRRDGNSLHIFPSDAGLGRKEALLLSYMRDRETREIIRSVYANPWTYPSELARSLDMSRSSAQWHLEKLEDSGIVNVVRDGKFSYLYIEPEMKDTVQKYLVQ